MSGGFLGGALSDMGGGLSSFGHDLTNGSFSNFAQHVPEGLWQDVNGGWGGIGTMLGSFFGQNEQMPGLRVLWAPLLAAGGAALFGGGAAAGGGAGAGGAGAGGSAFVGDIPLAGEGGTSIYSAEAGGGSGALNAPTETTPNTTPQNNSSDFWQRYLRNQAINQGIKQGMGLIQGGGASGGGGQAFGGFGGMGQQQRNPNSPMLHYGATPALAQGFNYGRHS